MRILIASVVMVLISSQVRADEKLKGIACRSVHLGYSAPAGTAFYNEARVDQSADGTYFMVAGFRHGYFGLQELANGKKLILFSVWDPTSGNDPKKVPEDHKVKTLHKDEGVRVGRFGGEGTGGQSFFDYDWKAGETYRFLVTAKADGAERTAYSGYFYLNDARKWKHLVTFSTLTKGMLIEGTYSFVEDFRRNKISTTKTRKATFGNGWLKTTAGEWTELTKCRFTADANPVVNIDAGVKDSRFFLATGGMIENTNTPLRKSMERPKSKGVPDDLPLK